MSAADLLLNNGLTICASYGGGFRILGIGGLQPSKKQEMIVWAKEHREELKRWAKQHPPRQVSGGANYAAFCSGYWQQCEGCSFYQRDKIFFCGKWNAVFYDSPVIEVVVREQEGRPAM